MPRLKIDEHGAIIRAQFMGVRLSEHRLLASNYKSPQESVYLKLFPESLPPMRNGVLDVCPNRIRGLVVCGTPDKSCTKCKEEFWLEEIK